MVAKLLTLQHICCIYTYTKYIFICANICVLDVSFKGSTLHVWWSVQRPDSVGTSSPIWDPSLLRDRNTTSLPFAFLLLSLLSVCAPPAGEAWSHQSGTGLGFRVCAVLIFCCNFRCPLITETPEFLGASQMTTKFLTTNFAKFPNFVVVEFPRKKSVLGQFSVNAPPPQPPPKRKILPIWSSRRPGIPHSTWALMPWFLCWFPAYWLLRFFFWCAVFCIDFWCVESFVWLGEFFADFSLTVQHFYEFMFQACVWRSARGSAACQ